MKLSKDQAPELVPQANPVLRIDRFRNDVTRAIDRVTSSNSYILGPEIQAFESEFSALIEAEHAIGVASGTDALTLSLMGLGIGPGDEVLVPALTAPATAIGVLRSGATIRLVDVDSRTRGIDPSLAENAIGGRTRAIVAVHLHGIPAHIQQLADLCHSKGLVLIEDCAQAHGATADGRYLGTFGHAAAFSFYPTKNLGAIGDAGCVVTNSQALATRIHALRNYGFGPSGEVATIGVNSRMDELQAGILRALLPHLAAGNLERQKFAASYDALFASLPSEICAAIPPNPPGSVYHQYAVELENRAEAMAVLRSNGVQCGLHYAKTLAQHEALWRAAGNDAHELFPVAEHLSQTLVSMPIQPELRQFEQQIHQAVRQLQTNVPDLARRGIR